MATTASGSLIPSDVHVALVLGGGNALGGYQAGVYQALHEAGVMPHRIVGTSVGAINGAIIAGNGPELRLDRLRDFWRPGPRGWFDPDETTRRTQAALGTLIGGRPGLFAPIGPLGSWWLHDPAAGARALYDTRALATTLADLVDWPRLNDGDVRYAALAVDVENGEERLFDTADMQVRADHVRASAALLPAFPPIEVDGRLMADGGLSANLPVDPVLAVPRLRTLCVAVDLLPLAAPPPNGLGEAAQRMQDLMFAAQSRRSIAHWRALYAASPPPASDGDQAAVTLIRLAYSDQEDEVAGKAMDFSPASVAARWQSGLRDGVAMLAAIEAGEITLYRPGLTIHGSD